MNTATFDEAEIVDEKPKVDLLEELKKQTEKKTPDASSAQKAWNFEDEEDEEKFTPKNTEEIQKESPEKKSTAKGKEPSEKELEASAEAGTAMVDFFLGIVGETAVKIRYKKKFTEEEHEQLEEKVIDELIENLTPEEQMLRRKYDRLEKAKAKKLKDVEITDKKRAKLKEAFHTYSKVTGKVLGPELIIISAILDVVIHTGVEAFTD